MRERRAVQEDLVLNIVREVRREHPRMGTRKVWTKITSELQKAGVEMGRDRFFELLKKHQMRVAPLPRRYAVAKRLPKWPPQAKI